MRLDRRGYRGAGDDNGYESNPARACVSDNSDAQDTNSGTDTSASCGVGAVPSTTKDRHQFYGFAFGLPGTASHIDGIRVQVDLGLDANAGTNSVCVQLSGDGGTTWTSIQSQAITKKKEATYHVRWDGRRMGSSLEPWPSLSGSAFRVRIIDASTNANRDFQLDYVAVSVTYAP